MLEAEFGLMGLIVGLYLYDSALLLYCNEGVLIPKGRAGWVVGFGSRKVQMLGKELFVPNPLLLHRPMFRLAWAFEGGGSAEQWAPRRNLFRSLAPLVWSMAVALFVLLPLGLFTRLGDGMLLLALGLLYLSLLASLLWLWFKRKVLNLSARQLAALSFECLVCAPFALNLVRGLSARMPVKEDLAHAARRLQAPDDWRLTRLALIARLDEEIECEEDGSERQARLRDHRRTLAEEDTPCPPPKSS